MSASPDPTSPSSTSKFEGLGSPVGVTEKFSVGELSSTCCGVGSPTAVSCFSGELPEDVLPFSPSTAKGFVSGAGAAGFAEVDDGALPRLGSAEEVGLVNFTFFFLRKSRRGDPFASGRHGDMRALEMSKSIVDAKCERGATTRGCSGGRGSDDTRGYGVGSGDVGKELPRGWSRKSVSL